ncbi:MAG: DegQ family serine endoprotease [Xanthomonadaceae bacterium]|nr:DegQ family serine endoprotease [Xanthomonadaceae bacterium]
MHPSSPIQRSLPAALRLPRMRALALVVATAAATTAVVLPLATAQAPTPPPQMVSLPDFTNLVDQVGPGVVNVEAKIGDRRNQQAQAQSPDDDDMPEFFRRFFGPGMPMPGMPPQGPGGSGGGTSMGTGFIISGDGYVLTNRHVIDGADMVTVRLSDRREFQAKVIGSDEQSDVALLKIAATGLPTLRLGDSNLLRPGQWVVAIGSPFGLDHSVTAGIVSAVGRSNPYADQRYVPFIQTDVAINRGNSGGPLLNTRGEVIGINSQIFSNSGGYMGVSFAIPIDVAMSAVKQLKSTGRVARGQIGVNVQQIGADDARGLGLPDTRGALVVAIAPGSAAEKAGLEPSDVIRSFNGTAINDSSDLPPLVGALSPGSHARLGVLRDGKPRDFDLTLTQLDEGIANAAPAPGVRPLPSKASNRLGLVTQPLDASDRKQLGLKPGQGVAIARVEGLAARSAGLQPGDIVLSVGRAPVDSPSALDRELAHATAGQPVMLLVRRGTATQFVAVTPRGDQPPG